jgi:Yip1-like protein
MATTPTPMPEAQAQPQASISPIGRIVGVFFSPGATFKDISQKPNWLAPMLLLIVIWFGLCAALVNRVDWRDYTKQQIEKNKFVASRFQDLPEEQKEAAYDQGARRSKISQYVRGVIGWPLLILFSAAINFGAFKLLAGVRTNFSTAFAITTFAHLPMSLRELLAIPVTFLKDPQNIDPQNFLASNPAALLGDSAPYWQLISFGSLDLFTIWALILIAVGFSTADPKKAPIGKALGISFGASYSLILLFTMIAWIFL